MLMTLWDCFHHVGRSSGDIWLAANIMCTISYIPHIHSHSHYKHKILMRTFMLFSLWIDDFLRLFWASHRLVSTHRSLHGHISVLCERQTCSACVGAVLVVFASHLHFYVSVCGWLFLLLESPLGSHYVLCVVALLCLLENSSICPFRKRTPHSCLSVTLLRKHQCPFPLSISVYLWQRWPVVDIKCLCWLIIHDHLNKLQNAPWHFYWRQSTADGTNVFLSGAIKTIKVSSGTWDQCLMTRLSSTVSGRDIGGLICFLWANCFIKMNHRANTIMYHSCVKQINSETE